MNSRTWCHASIISGDRHRVSDVVFFQNTHKGTGYMHMFCLDVIFIFCLDKINIYLTIINIHMGFIHIWKHLVLVKWPIKQLTFVRKDTTCLILSMIFKVSSNIYICTLFNTCGQACHVQECPTYHIIGENSWLELDLLISSCISIQLSIFVTSFKVLFVNLFNMWRRATSVLYEVASIPIATPRSAH